ncbi:MAG: hypothetical protein N3G75_07830, partial [Methanothrix sp.]
AVADDALMATQESEASADDASASSSTTLWAEKAGIVCNVLDGSFWVNLQSYRSSFSIRSSGETHIQTGASGWGEVVASAATLFDFASDWKSVGQNSELHAIMQSEVSNGQPSADVRSYES